MALCEEVAAHEGTTLEYITNGCLDQFSDDEVDLMTAMSVTAQRPLNWNVLTIDGRSADMVDHQLSASSRAAEAGGRIVALTMPTLVPMNMSFATFCALFLMPGWGEVMGLPPEERMAKLADPDVRALLDQRARSKEAGSFRGLANWGTYVIGDTYSAANEGYQGQMVRDIAAARGTADFDTLLDIVLADELRTVLWPNTDDGNEKTWAMRAEVWSDPRAMIGGSDAGAHLDRMCGSNYPTAFLADCLRGRQLVPLTQAVHMLSGQPAAALRAPRARRVGHGVRGRCLRLRPGHRRLRAGPPGPRPARRRPPPHRRIARRRAGPRQRRRDGPRRAADRGRSRHPAPIGPRHRLGTPRRRGGVDDSGPGRPRPVGARPVGGE